MNQATTSSSALRARPWRLMAMGLLVAASALAVQLATAAPHGSHRMHAGAHGGAMAGGFGGGMGERMLDSVNATDEQRTRIRDIMKAARDDVAKQREGQRALREQSLALLSQPTIDARAAESLRQQMLAGHDATSKRMMQAMLDAAAVLTPEQRAQMAERMKQRRAMMERHREERRALDRPAR